MNVTVNSNKSLANVDLRKDNFQMWLLNEGHLLKSFNWKTDSEYLPSHGQNCWNCDFFRQIIWIDVIKIMNNDHYQLCAQVKMTWNKMKSSILVISFVFAILFGTLMIHQNATLSAENMRTIFKTSVMWTQNKINGYSRPNVVKLLVLGYPR